MEREVAKIKKVAKRVGDSVSRTDAPADKIVGWFASGSGTAVKISVAIILLMLIGYWLA